MHLCNYSARLGLHTREVSFSNTGEHHEKKRTEQRSQQVKPSHRSQFRPRRSASLSSRYVNSMPRTGSPSRSQGQIRPIIGRLRFLRSTKTIRSSRSSPDSSLPCPRTSRLTSSLWRGSDEKTTQLATGRPCARRPPSPTMIAQLTNFLARHFLATFWRRAYRCSAFPARRLKSNGSEVGSRS
jgi:hypothetical protein